MLNILQKLRHPSDLFLFPLKTYSTISSGNLLYLLPWKPTPPFPLEPTIPSPLETYYTFSPGNLLQPFL